MDSFKTFPQISEINEKVINKNDSLGLSINDVRNIALLKFDSISGFGRALGITQGMASRLLSGDYIPLKPESIKKIADCLNIDSILLTQIYAHCKIKKEIAGVQAPESLSENKQEVEHGTE